MASTAQVAEQDTEGPHLRSIGGALLGRFLVQLGPGLVFFGVFAWQGIVAGTIAFLAATLISIVITAVRHRTLPTLPLVSAVLVACFGGLTIVYGEAAYIQMQPTITNGLYGLILGGAMLTGHDLLRRAFAPRLCLDAAGWRTLTWRLVGYLLLLALANEVVRRGFSVDVWIAFKAFVVAGLNLCFAVAQVPLLRAHWAAEPAEDG